MAIKSLKALTEAGIALREARDMKNRIEEEARDRKAPYEAQIEKLEAELLGGFKSLGMDSFKLGTGETITRSVKKGAEVINELRAIEWAKPLNLVKLDLRLVSKMLKQNYIEKEQPLPEGFALVEREEVRVTVPKPKGEAAEDSKE